MKRKRRSNSSENVSRPFTERLQNFDTEEFMRSSWTALKKWSKMRDPPDSGRERAFTTIAFVAIALAAMSLTAAGISLPLLCAHVNNIQMRTRLGLEYCQGSAGDVLMELRYGKRLKQKAKVEMERTAGSNMTRVMGGRDLGGAAEGECSPCCLPGEPGPAGKPGKMGKPVSMDTNWPLPRHRRV